MENPKIKLYFHFSHKEHFVYERETYDCSVLFINVSGSFQYRINNSALATVNPGEIVYCPPFCSFWRKTLSPVELHMIKFEGTCFALLGAGGAAKAVALKLVQQGAKQVTVCNRTVDKAAMLASHSPSVMSTSDFSSTELSKVCSSCDVLINCTNLGMAGSPAFENLDFVNSLPKGAPVCDLIYHPLKTALLERAEAQGHPIMNGLPLLIHQAILALEHFTQTQIDAKAMLPLVEAALAKAL